jgi:hypothetical protein
MGADLAEVEGGEEGSGGGLGDEGAEEIEFVRTKRQQIGELLL